jgi:hypothetical protein
MTVGFYLCAIVVWAFVVWAFVMEPSGSCSRQAFDVTYFTLMFSYQIKK